MNIKCFLHFFCTAQHIMGCLRHSQYSLRCGMYLGSSAFEACSSIKSGMSQVQVECKWLFKCRHDIFLLLLNFAFIVIIGL
jgi:hypothetical protein